MALTDGIGLLVLFLGWGAQITLRSFLVRYRRFAWSGALLVVLGIMSFRLYAQYAGWAAGPPGIYLLPPYEGWWYFYTYAGKRIAAPWLIAIFAAILLPRIAERLNLKYDERFFEPEEMKFFALGILLAGYPGFLFYIVFILIFELLFSAYYRFFSSQKRAPLYFAWFPLAIFAILVKNWLFTRDFLALFNL